MPFQRIKSRVCHAARCDLPDVINEQPLMIGKAFLSTITDPFYYLQPDPGSESISNVVFEKVVRFKHCAEHVINHLSLCMRIGSLAFARGPYQRTQLRVIECEWGASQERPEVRICLSSDAPRWHSVVRLEVTGV